MRNPASQPEAHSTPVHPRRAALRTALAAALVLAIAMPAAAGEPGGSDPRPGFATSFYFGLGIDSFAASDLNRYLNPEASSRKLERGVGGFEFAYRLRGAQNQPRQVWVYGETAHGMRSADLDLSGLDSLSSFRLTGYADPGSRTLYLLRNASSLEALAGLRLELTQLATGDAQAVSTVYVFAQYGFLTISGAGQDVLDQGFYGAGVGCIVGDLAGSRLEVGYGRSDYFLSHAKSRFKVSGQLEWTNKPMRERGMGMFTQITIDSDIGPGSDSVQSYFGFDFDLRNFLRLP